MYVHVAILSINLTILFLRLRNVPFRVLSSFSMKCKTFGCRHERFTTAYRIKSETRQAHIQLRTEKQNIRSASYKHRPASMLKQNTNIRNSRNSYHNYIKTFIKAKGNIKLMKPQCIRAI